MTYKRHHAILLAITLCMTPVMTALAQSTTPGEIAGPAQYKVTQIMGLPDAKPDIKGRLTTTETGLQFTSPDYMSEIPFSRMTSVSAGEVRIETGGKTGRIVRTMIPYGGGVAVATVTQKSVDLLTVEYLDMKGGYHGAVFFMPKSSARALSDRISSQVSAIVPEQLKPSDGGSANPGIMSSNPSW